MATFNFGEAIKFLKANTPVCRHRLVVEQRLDELRCAAVATADRDPSRVPSSHDARVGFSIRRRRPSPDDLTFAALSAANHRERSMFHPVELSRMPIEHAGQLVMLARKAVFEAGAHGRAGTARGMYLFLARCANLRPMQSGSTQKTQRYGSVASVSLL